jgi:propanol-preferring alcohol dehydrogenase
MVTGRSSLLCRLHRAAIELQLLSAINTVFDPLARGEVPSRVVIDFSRR